MRIRVNRDVCIGAGMCALSAPGVFAQARDDGRVVLVAAQPALLPETAAARKASYLCPSGAITLEPD